MMLRVAQKIFARNTLFYTQGEKCRESPFHCARATRAEAFFLLQIYRVYVSGRNRKSFRVCACVNSAMVYSSNNVNKQVVKVPSRLIRA